MRRCSASGDPRKRRRSAIRGSSPSSIAARNRRASSSPTAATSTATPAWGWSARSSLRGCCSEELAGHAAIGHVRYSTTGSSKLCNAQPLLRQYLTGAGGGGPQRQSDQRRSCCASEYEEHGHIFQSTTDTEIIVHLLAKPTHVEKHDPLPHVLKHLQGAFSLLFLFPDRMEAVPRSVGHSAAGAREDARRALVRGQRNLRV